MKFTTLLALTTGLQAVATILSAVRVITVSLKSFSSTTPNDNSSEQDHKTSGRGMHKWIIVAGAVVGLITIAYLENIVTSFKRKQSHAEEKPTQEKFESVYVNS